MTAPVRVGLVGAGPWAEVFTAPLLTGTPHLALAGVWARRPAAAAAVAGRCDVPVFATFEELLDACEAVAFNVPPDVQAGLALRAARAGKHLMLEKPLALDLERARAVADAVGAAGVASQLMLTLRYSAPVREWLADVAAHRVAALRASMVSSLAGSPFATPWRLEPRGALFDLGPHALDLLDAAGGPIEAVAAFERDGVSAITTHHAGGVTGQLVLSLATPGASGGFRAEAITDGGVRELVDPLPADGMATLHDTIAAEFARAVRDGWSQPLGTGRGLHLQRVIAAVEAALAGRSGEPVRIL